MKTIEQIIGDAFSSSLGQQCNSLFATSDNRVFVRAEEAVAHIKGELDNTEPLKDRTITEWFEEWHGGATHPDFIPVKLSEEYYFGSNNQDAISITSVDNLHLHEKDGKPLSDQL